MANDSKMVRVMGLWKEKSQRTGATYLAGKLGMVRVMIFPVKEKSTERSPDYTLFIAPIEEQAQRQGGRAQPPTQPAAPAKPEDDIPF